MTRADIRTAIREELEDSGSFYTGVDINRAIQKCYTKYAKATFIIEKEIELDYEGDRVYYDFSSLIPNYLRTFIIFDNVTNRWLDMVPRLLLDGLRVDWEIMAGSARWSSIINHKYVAITPVQSISNGTFTVYYAAHAPTLTNDTEKLVVLNESLPVFVAYSKFYLMLQAKEFSKARIHHKEYTKELENTLELMNSRGLPSRQYQLKG